MRSGKRQEQEDEAGGGFPKEVCFHFFLVVRLKPSRSLFKFESFKLSPPAAVTIKRVTSFIYAYALILIT
jgi:hypothetical protein